MAIGEAGVTLTSNATWNRVSQKRLYKTLIFIIKNVFTIYCYLGPTPKEDKQPANNKAEIKYQIKLGNFLTSIEYKLSNIRGTIIRRIESITLIAPNNRPICDGGTKLVCKDFIAGVVIIPNADTIVTIKFREK